MADTQASEACAARYEGSTPSLRINLAINLASASVSSNQKASALKINAGNKSAGKR